MTTSIANNDPSPTTTTTTIVAAVGAEVVQTTLEDDHSLSLSAKRFFIGPLPKTIATPQLRRTRRIFRSLAHIQESDEEIQSPDDISEERIWRLIQRSRGREHDWDREVTPRLRHELVEKFRRSPWSPLRQKQASQKNHTKWIGDSFEVGVDFFGNNVIVEEPERSVSSSKATSSKRYSKKSSSKLSSALPRSSLMTGGSYVTAENEPLETPANDSFAPKPLFPASSFLPPPHEPVGELNSENDNQVPTISDAYLLSQSHSDGPPESSQSFASRNNKMESPRHGSKAAGLPSALRRAMPSDIQRRRRQVSFASNNQRQPADQDHRAPLAPPAPPTEVLMRRNSRDELGRTSAGAVAARQRSAGAGDIVLKDRMLVQVTYSRSSSLPIPYDEGEARRHPENERLEWGEFVVTWKQKTIELHKNYAMPGKGWLLGQNSLAHVVSLDKPSVRLSIYSYTDMSFCLTCPPSSSDGSPGHSRFHKSAIGTSIFIFKCKARSRSIDWIWLLWRELGGELPSTIDVQVPVLGTRITLDVPEYDVSDGGEGYKTLTAQHIIDLCREVLDSMPEYKSLVKAEGQHGAELGLAWRRNMKLDWIWLDRDVDGAPRDWDVLFGLALNQRNVPLQLELRVASHSPTKVRMPDGEDLLEPHSIEGYLYRIKPNTQARTNTYVASHDGNLFTIPQSHASPPRVPQGPLPLQDSSETSSQISQDSSQQTIYTAGEEIQRGAEQILHATGYLDFRDILDVRRAIGVYAPLNYDVGSPVAISGGANGAQSSTPTNEEIGDDDDPGGEEHLNQSSDKSSLKVKRSFELVMRSGAVIRFEAHSVRNALQWVQHIKELIRFWTRRHQLDARTVMDLVHLSTGKPRVEIRADRDVKTLSHAPFVLPDLPPAAASLGLFWTWCTLNVCRPIIKSGRLYSKKRPRKHYKHMYMILIPGHIVLYHVTNNKFGYHHHSQTINLVDAYVYSGFLAIGQLPSLLENTAPRRYQDGLETSDLDIDTTFIVRHRPQPNGWENAEDEDGMRTVPKASGTAVPPLNAKYKLLILKARSQLERDAWCWALNSEIERLVRIMSSREKHLREES